MDFKPLQPITNSDENKVIVKKPIIFGDFSMMFLFFVLGIRVWHLTTNNLNLNRIANLFVNGNSDSTYSNHKSIYGIRPFLRIISQTLVIEIYT